MNSTQKHIVLVSCCGPKALFPTAARDLYQSRLFKVSREWAARFGDQWFILSAKYGLVAPGDVIAPYDLRLQDVGKAALQKWNERVAAALAPFAAARLTILAGTRYCGWRSRFPDTVEQLEGVAGIGPRIAQLQKELKSVLMTNPRRALNAEGRAISTSVKL